ncbi:hypothetical protein scyTo_0017280 [Scyliorhinus torazame]|uniref:Ig-like domain-containing protein n=1 Tax=Scyliorhinus torazame TaxID=75743 RepID=A0A401Q5N8_SCYTO|nr:hypothetical protein [Scyliorhinus torazame]
MLSIATGTLCQSIISYSTPYLAVRQGKRVTLSCSFEKKLRLNVTWYKDEEQPIKVKELKGIVTGNEDNISWVIIEKATKFHSGVYYCSCPSMDTARTQCGTEVNVIQNSVKKETNTIYTMKDMLILIQGILLILCLTLPGMLFFNKNNQAKKTEETETYHMYEGLEVMQAAMYEDIGNVKSSDAKWTLGEQPNE